MFKNLTSGTHWSVTHNRTVIFSFTARKRKEQGAVSGELTGGDSRELGRRGGEGEEAERIGEACRI